VGPAPVHVVAKLLSRLNKVLSSLSRSIRLFSGFPQRSYFFGSETTTCAWGYLFLGPG
jgi:hypothetical protein